MGMSMSSFDPGKYDNEDKNKCFQPLVEHMEHISQQLLRLENDACNLELSIDNEIEKLLSIDNEIQRVNSWSDLEEPYGGCKYESLMDCVASLRFKLKRIKSETHTCEDYTNKLDGWIDNLKASAEDEYLTNQKKMRQIQTELSQLLNQIDAQEDHHNILKHKMSELVGNKLQQQLDNQEVSEIKKFLDEFLAVQSPVTTSSKSGPFEFPPQT